MPLNPTQNETLRHAALEVLVPRYPATVTPAQITRHLKKEIDFDFDYRDLEGALEFLREAKYARVDFDAMGSTPYWCATSEGVLWFERNLK